MGPGARGCCEGETLVSRPDPGAVGLGILGTVQSWAHDAEVPLNATLEITQRCNLRCKHCYNFDRDEPRALGVARDDTAGSRELSTPELLSVIDDVARAGCLFLNFTGGEALLHPDLMKLMDRAAELNLAVSLLTNGLLLRPGLAGQLAAYSNLLKVSVSLYGARADTHDALTQVSGSFARTWAGARLLRELGVGVTLKFIVTHANAGEVEQMMADADAGGWSYNLDLTVTARNDGNRTSLPNRVDLVQLQRLLTGPLRQLAAIPPRGDGAASFSCNCARGNCAVGANGDVYPCIAAPLVAGNVRQQPFAEIWATSPVFRWIRQLRIEDYAQCHPCAHRPWCSGERGAAVTYSGSYTGIDPLVCARAEIVHGLATEAADPERPGG